MIEQLTLGVELGKRGMENALLSKPEWSIAAERWLDSLEIGREFTSEDLTHAIGWPAGADTSMNANNAIGAKIRGWAGKRTYKIGYQTAKGWRSHGRAIAAWRKIA